MSKKKQHVKETYLLGRNKSISFRRFTNASKFYGHLVVQKDGDRTSLYLTKEDYDTLMTILKQ